MSSVNRTKSSANLAKGIGHRQKCLLLAIEKSEDAYLLASSSVLSALTDTKETDWIGLGFMSYAL